MEDIDPQKTFDLKELDNAYVKVIRSSVNAVESCMQLSPFARRTTTAMMRSFDMTHRSIRALIKTMNKRDGQTADGISLAREQVEKVFTMAIFALDVENWTGVYGKSAWTKTYRNLLQTEKSVGDVERFREFVSSTGPDIVEKARQEYGITEEEAELVKFKFDNPQTQRPKELEGVPLYSFPMPGGIRKEFSAERQSYFERWLAEYEHFSLYVHILLPKLNMVELQQYQQSVHWSKEFFEKESERAIIASYMAGVCASLDAYTITKNVEGLIPAVELLNLIAEGSILARELKEKWLDSMLPPALPKDDSP